MRLKFILAILVLFTLTSFISNEKTVISKNKCRTIEDAVQQTIKALKKRDIGLFMEMWGGPKYEMWLKENPQMDHVTELLENICKSKEFQEEEFNTLLKHLDSNAGSKEFNLEYVSHKIVAKQKSNGITDNMVEITFKLNDKYRKVLAPMVEYKGCVYFFEPIYNFTSGIN